MSDHAKEFVDLLQEFIEAVIKDVNSDHVEDRLYMFQVKTELLNFLNEDA